MVIQRINTGTEFRGGNVTTKIIFFLTVRFGKCGSFKILKKEYHYHEIPFTPVPGLGVKIDKKTHFIEDVVYDLDTGTYNAILEDDNSSGYTYRFSEFNKLVGFYIRDGWEEFIPTDYKNVITTPKMHEIIAAINDIKEELNPSAFIEMVCAIMIESKLTRSLELGELFYFCNLSTHQSLGIMERIDELSNLKREK